MKQVNFFMFGMFLVFGCFVIMAIAKMWMYHWAVPVANALVMVVLSWHLRSEKTGWQCFLSWLAGTSGGWVMWLAREVIQMIRH